MIASPFDAVTDEDPYPYYDDLATQPIRWDDALGMWIASGAVDVSAVLGHPAARVRPPDSQIPPALAGTQAGDAFGRLVRMNDRADRMAVKHAIVRTLAAVDASALAEAAAVVASVHLAAAPERDGDFVDRWITDFPIAVVAHLAGIDPFDVPVAIAAARDVGTCSMSGPAC